MSFSKELLLPNLNPNDWHTWNNSVLNLGATMTLARSPNGMIPLIVSTAQWALLGHDPFTVATAPIAVPDRDPLATQSVQTFQLKLIEHFNEDTKIFNDQNLARDQLKLAMFNSLPPEIQSMVSTQTDGIRIITLQAMYAILANEFSIMTPPHLRASLLPLTNHLVEGTTIRSLLHAHKTCHDAHAQHLGAAYTDFDKISFIMAALSTIPYYVNEFVIYNREKRTIGDQTWLNCQDMLIAAEARRPVVPPPTQFVREQANAVTPIPVAPTGLYCWTHGTNATHCSDKCERMYQFGQVGGHNKKATSATAANGGNPNPWHKTKLGDYGKVARFRPKAAESK